MAKRKIEVQGVDINLWGNDSEYVSLTDIARNFGDPSQVIRNYMRNGQNLAFLKTWELVHNSNFKPVVADRFIVESQESGAFNMTAKKWKEATDAVGILSKAGRYGGGTFAHRDITVGFCYWLSPVFQVYLVKEFNRLKEEEVKSLNAEWNIKRIMAKANYRIQTEAVREYLIPPKLQYTKKEWPF